MQDWKEQQTTGNLTVGDKVVATIYDKARDRDENEVVTIRGIYCHTETKAVKLRVADDDGVVQSIKPEQVVRKA